MATKPDKDLSQASKLCEQKETSSFVTWLAITACEPINIGYPALNPLGFVLLDFHPFIVKHVDKEVDEAILPFSSVEHPFKSNPPAIKHWATKLVLLH